MVRESSGNVIAKASALLRAIGSAGAGGSSTTELARIAGVPRPTAHRTLEALMFEGLVDRDRRTGAWMLGPELYLLGSRAAQRYDISDQAAGLLIDLARESGESAFLSARRGDETVCLLREEGSFPLRSHVLFEGIRLPLGVASAGLAILSHLPGREVDEYLARADLTASWGEQHSARCIRDRIAATQETGYSENPALLVEGSWGIGAAVFDAGGRPTHALSLTGVETRFGADRREQMGRLLLSVAHELTKRIAV